MTRPLRDPRLKFVDKGHSYFVDTEKYTSVTEFSKKFFLPFDTKVLSARSALFRRIKARDAIMLQHGIVTPRAYYGLDGKIAYVNANWKKFLKDYKLTLTTQQKAECNVTAKTIQKEWKATGDDGTLVHSIIEKHILGTLAYDEELLAPKKALNGIAFFNKLFGSFDRATAEPEVRIYDDVHKLAGTVDLVITDKTTGELTLVDWKTNSTISDKDYGKENPNPITGHLPDANLTHYTLQLSLYAYILETFYERKVKSLKIVHLTEDKAIPMEVPYMKDIVLEMLAHGTY
jgi:ATP-dependent exoDNAse (exonuclease V) beta subunit